MKNHWAKINLNGEIPFDRFHYSVDVIKDKLYLFGGYKFPNWFNDLYLLEIERLIWKKINAENSPSKRDWVRDFVKNFLF